MAVPTVVTCATLLALPVGTGQTVEPRPALAQPEKTEEQAPRRRARSGLSVNDPRLLLGMGVGWYVALYGASSATSALILDREPDPGERRAAKANLVPIVGPFVAAGLSGSAKPKAGYAVIGALRVGTLAAGTLGAIAYRADIGLPSDSEAWGMVGGGAMGSPSSTRWPRALAGGSCERTLQDAERRGDERWFRWSGATSRCRRRTPISRRGGRAPRVRCRSCRLGSSLRVRGRWRQAAGAEPDTSDRPLRSRRRGLMWGFRSGSSQGRWTQSRTPRCRCCRRSCRLRANRSGCHPRTRTSRFRSPCCRRTC